jgi:alpha-1,2-mannosyltransferase
VSTIGTTGIQRLGTLLLALAAACYTFYVYVIVPTGYPLADFVIYSQAAKTLLAGGNIYRDGYPTEIAPGHTFLLPYLYPPFLAHVLSKFVSLPETTLKFVWNTIGFICVGTTVAVLVALTSPSWWRELSLPKRVAITGFFVICFEPLYHGVAYGQVTAIVLACLSLFVFNSIKGRDSIAGIALAIAIHIKVTPILLLLAPLLFGRWKTIAWCLSTTAVLAGVTILDLGSPRIFVDFFESLSQSLSNQGISENPFNFSLTHAILGPSGIPGNSLFAAGIQLGCIAASLLCILVIRAQKGPTYLRSIALIICTMVLVSPITWYHHFAWILIPLTVATMRVEASKEARLRTLTFALGIYFFLSKVFLLHITLFKTQPGLLAFSTVIPTLLLTGLMAMLLLQRE